MASLSQTLTLCTSSPIRLLPTEPDKEEKGHFWGEVPRVQGGDSHKMAEARQEKEEAGIERFLPSFCFASLFDDELSVARGVQVGQGM